MKINSVFIEGPLIIEPRVFKDDRGYFFESFNETLMREIGSQYFFIQDNQSMSEKNVVRGLHFQNPPFEQGKLIRVINGAVLDIIVDIRKKSKTYGRHFSLVLTGEDFKMLWIPPGFAHGFATLEDNTVFIYKCTKAYNRQAEGGILWNDPDLGIDWQVDDAKVSEKDMTLPLFRDFQSNF